MLRLVFLSFLIVQGSLVAAEPPQPHSYPQPLLFEQNLGQAQSQFTWMARGAGYQVLLTRNELQISFSEAATRRPRTLHLKLPGSQPWTSVAGLEPTGGVSNYIRNRAESGSLEGIPHYRRVTVAGVYRGIDLTLYSRGEQLEYDFVLHPNADPKRIQMAFEGQTVLRVDA